jgi:biopolymer transport protein ExbB
MEPSLGIVHFLAQADAVGKAIIVILALMSVASWYLTLLKLLGNAVEARAARRFLGHFRDGGAGDDGAAPGEAFGRIARDGMAASEHCRQHASSRFADTGPGELVARVLRQRVQAESARRERGLAFLAATASSAPFIGLFGTVWGIYHALLAIGLSGQGTLDKVAGPVGEALVMTAAGLGVAIPAVLAYNYLVRANRVHAGEMNQFASDLFTLLATGAPLRTGAHRTATAPRGTAVPEAA